MPSRDYYKTLQVDSEAEPEVIAAAYRRLSLKYHPDTNKAANATARMQEINEAYEVLKEPAHRARYDSERSARTASAEQETRGTWRAQAEPERWHEEKKRAETENPTEERRRTDYEWLRRKWAEIVRRRAAEGAEWTIQTFRAAPRGARVVKALSRQQVYGGDSFQEHTVPGGCWLDLAFEWITQDEVVAETTWPFLRVSVTVDGESIDNPRKQWKGPDRVVWRCPDQTRCGYVMTDALYIPPLPLGDHMIIWTIGFARDLDDGWNTYRQGTRLVVTSLLHVGKAG